MKLSIIVPVYNVAAYIRKSVESLLIQDYSDYEIILVDDGSTDGSAQICDEYAQGPACNPCIRVLHQPNSGVGAARNTGIANVHGEYVCFVDSDDYWEPNVLGSLMAQTERDKLDVLRFKYQNVNEKGAVFNPNKSDPYRNDDYSDSVVDGVTFLNQRLGTACYSVMYIMRRELLQNCLFTPGIYFEDTEWLPRMLVRAQYVASTDRIVYNYLVREGSITKAVQQEKRLKLLDDKMLLLRSMQAQANALQTKGQENAWYDRMIAATVISIIGILSTGFYAQRAYYLKQLQDLNVYPILPDTLKARLINFSPCLAVAVLHFRRMFMGINYK